MVYKLMNFGNHVQNEETGLISCPFFIPSTTSQGP